MNLHSRLFIRILSRNGDVYALKVFTLAVAFATCMLVLLFSIYEYAYDTHYKDPDRVYRLLARNTTKDFSGNRLSSTIPPGILQSISKKLSGRAVVSRIKVLKDVSVLVSDKLLYNQIIYAADSTIEKIFPIDIPPADINKFTSTRGNVAMLSKSKAVEYFGDAPPIGKTIRLTTFGDTLIVVVTAVFNDFPPNTHEDFHFFIRYDSSTLAALNFDPDQFNVYARLSPEVTSPPLLMGIRDDHSDYLLQPVKAIYFGPRVLHEEARHGDKYSMSIQICIVSLIFFLAICSFVNLSTMTLPYRSKEIAVKKLAGITQRQLLSQFVCESLALTSVSLIVSVILLLGTSRYLSTRLDMDVLHLLTNGSAVFLGGLVIMFFVVVISPVFTVIPFIRATPTRLLSTNAIAFPKFKRAIAVVQFGVSMFLIISSIIINRQINYSLQKEPGQNNDQIVYTVCPKNIADSVIYMIETGWPVRNPKIVDAVAVSQLPGHVQSKIAGSDLFQLQVDQNFKDFFHLSLRDGRWFIPSDDDAAFVVNQMAFKALPKVNRDVIGVVQDFSTPLNQPEQAVRITLAKNSVYNWVCIRVHEVDIRRTMAWIKKRMSEKHSYGNVYFLNSHFESWLRYQEKLNALSGILTVMSVLLAGCAIYGLIMSVVRDKLKEIAVHQLFGAGAAALTRVLAFGLLRQMLLAFVLFGLPAYILLTELLRTFAYATKVSWLDPVYPFGYCIALIIGLCTNQAFSLKRRNLISALKGNGS